MASRRILTKFVKQQVEDPKFIDLSGRARLTFHRSQSGYVGSVIPTEIRNDPERAIRLFESQPGLHSNQSALFEYVKALVKVDKLDGSQLLRALRKGISSTSKAEAFTTIPAIKNVGQMTKEGTLWTVAAPIHMVISSEDGPATFKNRFGALSALSRRTFLMISGVGAILEYRGLGKVTGLDEEVQPIMDSNTKFNDVKGVDEAKVELEEIVHHLRDRKVNERSCGTANSLVVFLISMRNHPGLLFTVT